jgi:hypothetical protein
MPQREIPRDEAEAALQTRHDLGRDYEPSVVDSFVERIDKVIEGRVADEVAKRLDETGAHEQALAKVASERANHRLALAIVSIVMGTLTTATSIIFMSIPLAGAALGPGTGMSAILLIWVAIVSINLVLALGGPSTGRRR